MAKQQQYPAHWQTTNLDESLPREAWADVIGFCEMILKEDEYHKKYDDSIGKRAATYLEKHQAVMREHGLDHRFFGYWLENTYNQKQFPELVEALKKALKRPASASPPARVLTDIIPVACIEKLQEFCDDLANGTLIIEPGKANITMLRERVLEPFRNDIIRPGSEIVDLDYLAMALCVELDIEPN